MTVRRGIPANARQKEAAIREQPIVLIISCQSTMRHLIERVCRCAGAKTVTVATGHEAHALAAREDLRAFSLVVMDITEPTQDAPCPTRMAGQLLQEWTAASPLLPFVCIVPVSQQHALLKIRADILRVVTLPVVLPALAEAIASSLPRRVQRARGFSVPVELEEMSDNRRFYGQIQSFRQMVAASIAVHTESPEEVVKHD